MLLAFQILFILFALFAGAGVVSRARRHELSGIAAVFWVVFWAAVIVVVARPGTAQQLAGAFGIGRGADLLLYSSIAVLFYLLFRVQIALYRIERTMTKIVRRAALEDAADKTGVAQEESESRDLTKQKEV